MTIFHKIMMAEKNNFPLNVQHNFTKRKVISKFKSYKP